jgi:hypothetical protein
MLSGGCELITSSESRLVDAGPDLVPASCRSSSCTECDPLPAAPCPGAPDASSPDATLSHDAGPDRGADIGGPDRGPDGGSTDAAAASGGSGGAAGGCGPGDDCDGLPRERDPWPQECNALLFSDDFSRSPEDTWGRSYSDLHIGVRSCGTLEWTAPAHHTLWAWLLAEPAKKLRPNVMAELRFFPKWRGSWTLTLATNVRSQDDMSAYETHACFCSFSFDEHGGRALSVRDELGSSSKRVDGFAVAGGSPVLQIWPDVQNDEIVCRLVPAKGKPIEVRAARRSKETGTIKIILSNTDHVAPYVWLWIDYVRAFTAGTKT